MAAHQISLEAEAPPGECNRACGALPEPAAGAEWRTHWRAALAVSVGVASGYAAFQFSASQFIAPWQAQFGWSRGEIAFAHNGLLLGALLSPWAGRLLDRHGVRRPIVLAMLLTGLGYLAMARMGGSLAEYYGVFLFVQLVGIMTTGLSFTRVIVVRFRRSRGAALAVARIGMAVFGMVLPGVVHAVIADEGWRAAFVLLAAITLLIGVPVCYWGVRDLKTDGETAEKEDRPGFLVLLKMHPKILLVCLAGGLHYAPIGAVLSQLQPLLVAKQVGAGEAAVVGGIFAAAVLVGTMMSGVLADRIWAPLVGCLFALGPLAGCLILLQVSPALWSVVLAIALIGMAQGAEIDVIAYLTARYFGTASFSAIYGLVMMATIICTFLAQVGIGFAFDHFGNYQFALQLLILLLGAAAITYLAMGRYPESRSVPSPSSDD